MAEDLPLISRFAAGLRRTRAHLVDRLTHLLHTSPIDHDLLEKLEEVLIAADMGMPTARRLLDAVSQRTTEPETLLRTLEHEIATVLSAPDRPIPAGSPHVVLVLGVNGVGKTTTIAKLAYRATGRGKQVFLAAADTFRAAAIEQLKIWGDRAGAAVIAHQPGGDPAAVVFDTLQAAQARRADLVLIDTAGRLHTKKPLMDELKKIRRTAAKALPGAPHETLLILDATTGLNAAAQAREFHDALGVTGLIVTKLDGTAKGGAVVGIVAELALPVCYVGVGEGMDDLEPFSPTAFAAALLRRDA